MAENESKTLLASAARIADVTVEERNHRWRGILISVDVTAIVATPLVRPRIQAKDDAGALYTIWSAAADIAATGKFSYLIYPGITVAAFVGTEAANLPLPLVWALFMDHVDADSITYSVKLDYLS